MDLVKWGGCFILKALKDVDPEKDWYILIVDIEGVSTSNINTEYLKEMMPILGNYYPDVLYKMIIVNMGFIFNMIFKAVKMMMHPVTRAKIISVGSSKND